MASNITVKDSTRSDVVVKTTETTGVHTPHHNVDAITPGVTAADLGKAEDAVHAHGDTGVMLLAVRKDTAIALAASDGDYIPLIVDGNGRLHVVPSPGSGASDLGKAEDAAHGSGDIGVMMLGVRKDTAAALATADGDYIPAIFDATGHLYTKPVPGSAALDLGKLEDAAHTSGDLGVMGLAVRKDTAASLGDTDGDYVPLIVDASGRLHVNLGAAIPAGANVIGSVGLEAGSNNIGDVDIASAIPAGSNLIGNVGLDPRASGGPSGLWRDIDLDETGQLVNAGASQVYTIVLINAGASALYVKLYDKATAPTVGTDTPVMTLPVASGADRVIDMAHGLPFALGIGAGCTTGVADADTGAPGANEMIAHIVYEP